jgi:hypothetical protein
MAMYRDNTNARIPHLYTPHTKCFKNASKMLQALHKSRSRHETLSVGTNASRMLQECFKNASRMLQECFKITHRTIAY